MERLDESRLRRGYRKVVDREANGQWSRKQIPVWQAQLQLAREIAGQTGTTTMEEFARHFCLDFDPGLGEVAASEPSRPCYSTKVPKNTAPAADIILKRLSLRGKA